MNLRCAIPIMLVLIATSVSSQEVKKRIKNRNLENLLLAFGKTFAVNK
ncbi:hypothetical protein [Candidatus Uabimicrobium sp. HlEnr_7]